MKILPLLLALCIPAVAAADPAVVSLTYSVTATGFHDTPAPTCGNRKRLLREKHIIRELANGTYTVDGQRWKDAPGSGTPGEVLLTYTPRAGNLTYTAMWFIANDRKLLGIYMVSGVTRKRKACSDTVRIEGVRL